VKRQPPFRLAAKPAAPASYSRLIASRSRAMIPAFSTSRRASLAARCSARRSGSSRACSALRRSHSGSRCPGRMAGRPPIVVALSANCINVVFSNRVSFRAVECTAHVCRVRTNMVGVLDVGPLAEETAERHISNVEDWVKGVCRLGRRIPAAKMQTAGMRREQKTVPQAVR